MIVSNFAQPHVAAFGAGLMVQADMDSGFGSLIRIEGRALVSQGLSLDFAGERFEVPPASAPEMAEALVALLKSRGLAARVWKKGDKNGKDLRAGVFVDSVKAPMNGVAEQFASKPAAPRAFNALSVRFL